MNKKRCGGLTVSLAVFMVSLVCISLTTEKGEHRLPPYLKQKLKEQEPSGKEELVAKMEELLNKMTTVTEKVQDYTCIFTKQEYVKNKLQRKETIFMKHRKKPHSVYMKWINKPHKNRESLYCEGKYGNKLQAHEGRGLMSLVGTLSLNPEGRTAMKGNRHPITEAGIFNTIYRIKKDFELAKENPEHNVLYERFEEKEILGQPSISVHIIQPKDKKYGYSAYKAEIGIHKELYLPVSVKIWDFTERLVEFYTYSEYKIDVEFTERDFDVHNKEYNFYKESWR